MNKIIIPASLKADATGGTFTGIANYALVVDSYQERVMPGAFTATLARKGNRFPLLWAHKVEEPLGEVELFESPRGLEVRQGRLVLSVQRAAEIYALLKEAPNSIGGMSIGFSTVREKFVKGIRELHEIELYEVSLTVMPANTASVVETVKASGDNGIERIADALAGMRRELAEEDSDRLSGLADTLSGLRRVLKRRTLLRY